MALITALAGLAGALTGGWAAVQQAKHEANAAIRAARMERYAAWQVQKRQIYMALLDATCDAQADDCAVRRKLAEAVLAAEKDLRAELLQLPPDVADLRRHLEDAERYKHIVEKMAADV
ncbi:hypothetical protein [Streptomyces lavendofoliae]|uniref:hypothetical protein n=1 Tax=Streptomyces lavendofoliae TaxID=67314 RepID=UPI003D943E94